MVRKFKLKSNTG